MACKLYVGNLPYRISNQELQELFQQAGDVASAAVVTDRETGQSRGFGFVEMADDEGAKAAITKFNGYMYQNRPLVVNEARPREDRPGGGGGGGRGGGGYGGGGGRGGGGYGGGGRDRY
ncbi:MAG TPA: RNA-binding protein [bacterium]|nr:RNA-binding protein [bacterium]